MHAAVRYEGSHSIALLELPPSSCKSRAKTGHYRMWRKTHSLWMNNSMIFIVFVL